MAFHNCYRVIQHYFSHHRTIKNLSRDTYSNILTDSDKVFVTFSPHHMVTSFFEHIKSEMTSIDTPAYNSTPTIHQAAVTNDVITKTTYSSAFAINTINPTIEEIGSPHDRSKNLPESGAFQHMTQGLASLSNSKENLNIGVQVADGPIIYRSTISTIDVEILDDDGNMHSCTRYRLPHLFYHKIYC